MPGAAHTGPTAPLDKRSTRNIILTFVICPLIVGPAALTMIVINAVRRAHEFTAGDWLFQVIVVGAIVLIATAAAPAVGLRELRRRREERDTRRAAGGQTKIE